MNRRLLFVHAHPDDESSKSAATAARYVDEGAQVVLVTCTGGEAGEVLNEKVGPITDLPARRAQELAEAVAIIGFTRSYLLGFSDSGYHLDPADVPDGTFASIPARQAAVPLAQILRDERPQVVVTYPEDGGYPHPDHLHNHAVTMAAVDLAADPGADLDGPPFEVPKVYANLHFPYERIKPIHDALTAAGRTSPYERFLERIKPENTPEITARVDVADWFGRRDDALRAHATQVDPDGFWFDVPIEIEREIYPWETYVLLRGTPGRVPEDDLFAGLSAE